MVGETWLNGGLNAKPECCETRVMNTCLVWLRWQCMRGQLAAQGLTDELGRVQDFLAGLLRRMDIKPSLPSVPP